MNIKNAMKNSLVFFSFQFKALYSSIFPNILYNSKHELIVNKGTDQWQAKFYTDYIGEVDIYLMNRQDERKYGIKLMEVFPKTIGATDLSQSANNELIKLAVTFSFRYWTTLDTNRAVSLGGNASNSSISSTRNFSLNMPASVTRLGGSSGNVSYDYTQPNDNRN